MVNYFRKTLHLKCLTGFWIRLCPDTLITLWLALKISAYLQYVPRKPLGKSQSFWNNRFIRGTVNLSMIVYQKDWIDWNGIILFMLTKWEKNMHKMHNVSSSSWQNCKKYCIKCIMQVLAHTSQYVWLKSTNN